MTKNISYILLVGIVGLVVGIGGGYALGNSSGYSKGFEKGKVAAQEDLKKVQEEAAKKAAAQASKAANPFQAVNPLEGVETNPFEKTKQILNPFE